MKVLIKILLLFFTLIFLHSLSLAQKKQFTDSRGTPVPADYLKQISIDFDDVPLKQALNSVSQKGGFKLNYIENILPEEKSITIKITNKPAIEVLEIILLQNKLGFIITKSGQIVLIKYDDSVLLDKDLKYTISGFITDKENGEALIGTNIIVTGMDVGAATNRYGFYSLTLPAGEYSLRISYIGYETKEVEVFLFSSMTKNIELSQQSFVSDTIIVVDEEVESFESTEMSTVKLAPQKLNNIPVLFGEQDILKVLHLLPGITSTREGDTGFLVRGGEPDQNLVLLDEAPVYNAFHFFGFFSVFNSDAIKDIRLMKGAAPPKYGGRVSSVLDIQMNEGNLKEYKGSAGIGLIFSRLNYEGPIVKNKGSFIFSGRRTYADLFLKLADESEVNKSVLHFYDFNLKANYWLGVNDRLYLSGYFGRDAMGFEGNVDINWGNKTGTLRWNHLFSDKMFLNSSFIVSNFNHTSVITGDDESSSEVSIISDINNITLKEDFQYFHDINNTYSFGMNYTYHTFLPGEIIVDEVDNPRYDLAIGKRSSHEGALYFSHEYKYNNKLTLDYGLRLSMFSVSGEGDDYDLDDFPGYIDLEFHKKEHKFYYGWEPRFTANYQLDNSSSLKFGYARNYQYLHKLSTALIGSIIDIWQPVSKKIAPQKSDLISLGYYKNFDSDNYEFSVETYYKDLRNQLEFKNGAILFFGNFFESEYVTGKGWSYGIEFLLKKNLGDFTGWIGYSLSKTEKQFPDLNSGTPFPSKYDRTHDFSIVTNYKINENWVLSANWVYYTGNSLTVPSGQYTISGKKVDAYTPRNNYRLPDYHRLDLGISYTTDGGGVWQLFLYNAYARKNSYSLFFRENQFGYNEAVRLSIFTIVPSLSYSFSF